MRTAFDCSHVKSVKAWGLIHQGEFAGRIVANYSDNPNGSVCTLTIAVFSGPIAEWSEGSSTAKAGGGGYCKFSSAFAQAIRKMERLPDSVRCSVDGAGESSVRSFLESFGYTCIEVL